MALLAESLVEEWLNRVGFFTVRGVKHGLGEIDLLAIKRQPDGPVIGWHVEVQASFRPMGYIAKLTPDIAKAANTARSSARSRTTAQIEACAREWVHLKFRADGKAKARERLWPQLNWSFHLVHAVVREQHELSVFEAEGVQCHCFKDLLTDLSQNLNGNFSGSAGGDLADIITYYAAPKAN
jgi:hypothetical protein